MLKGQEFDLADLAIRSNMNNLIHYKVTLRDKLYFELGIIKTEVPYAFEGKKERKRKVIYACNTKWIYNQAVPPGYETGFLNYNYKENTYGYEISYMDILVEFDSKESSIITKDSDNNDFEIRRLFRTVMENFAYKYNQAASGKSFLDPVFYSTTAFRFRSFYRKKLTGEFECSTGTIIPMVGEKRGVNTLEWDIDKAIDSEFVMWRFYLNKAKYCFSIRMYIECILYAAMSIEAYLMQIIKEHNLYDDYIAFANNGNTLGFTTAKNYIRKKALIDIKRINMIDKTYKKIKSQRAQIVHGLADTPYLDSSLVEQTCIGLNKIFDEIEKEYQRKMTKEAGSTNWYYKCHDLMKIKKLCDLEKHEEAIKLLSENIANDVYVDVSYFNRACAYSVLGKSNEAIADFKICLKNKYKITETYDRLGKEYFKQAEFTKANETYNCAIEADENNQLLYHNRANVLIHLKKYEEALRDMTKAIEIEPSATNYNGRAVACAYLKKYDEALRDFGIALELEPQDSRILYGRSQIFFEVRKPEEAEEDAMEAIKFDEKMLEKLEVRRFFASLFVMYIEQDKQDKARELHSKCKKIFADENVFSDLLQCRCE